MKCGSIFIERSLCVSTSSTETEENQLHSNQGSFFLKKKSIILAIYADFPAARKCACTGSACPQCFRKQKEFADAIAAGALMLRTPARVGARKRALQNMARTQITAAQKRANTLAFLSG